MTPEAARALVPGHYLLTWSEGVESTHPGPTVVAVLVREVGEVGRGVPGFIAPCWTEPRYDWSQITSAVRLEPTAWLPGDTRACVVSFLYLLLRDHLLPGAMEEVMDRSLRPGERSKYSNPHLAAYAESLATRLGL